MAVQFTRWERFPTTDREAFAEAALGLCRSAKANGQQARFYWATANSIVILREAPTAADLWSGPTPEGAKALYAMADLAQTTGTEMWQDPRAGVESYRIAGR